MRKIIIGDVHGCINELRELINKVNISTSDELYFIGDLIDRGPSSIEVIKYISNLSKSFRIIIILGNHEYKLLKYIKKKKRKLLNNDQLISLYDDIIQNVKEEEIEIIYNSYFNFNIITQNRYLLVHGGILNNLTIDLTENHKYNDEVKSSNDLQKILFTRYVTKDKGSFLSYSDKDRISSILWCEKYNCTDYFVIYGHQPIMSSHPQKYNNTINIDGGCVYGGWLIGLIIENDELTSISVKSQFTYSN